MNSREVFDRYKRRTNKNSLNSKQKRIEQMTKNYEYYLDEAVNSLEYEDYYTGRKSRLTVIDVNADNLNGDEKYITTSFGDTIKSGDVVRIGNKVWIVYNKEFLPVPSHKKFKIKPCNLDLKIRDIEGKIVNIPCYYVNQTMYNIGIKKTETNQINFGDTIVKVYMSAEAGRKYIYRGMRILIMVNGRPTPYEATYLDTTQEGLLIFQTSEDKLTDEDDIENMIAHNYKENNSLPINPTELYINGVDPLSVSSEYMITSETIPHGQEFELDFEFSVDREDFARVEKVDNKTCILYGLKAREYVVLTAKCGDIELKKDILIKDVEVVK